MGFPMNRLHHWICRSSSWKRTLQRDLLPWALDGLDLGASVLEIGPGYGSATALLRQRVPTLTCVELDPRFARRLVLIAPRVVQADGANLPFPAGIFSAVVCFTMLHHLPSPAHQDRLFAEAARVLRPGGIFAGTDNTSNPVLRLIHAGDTFTPIDHRTIPPRLQSAGFTAIGLARNLHSFRFRAHLRPQSM